MSSKSKYKPKTRRYNLSWAEDHELHGLQVTMRAMRMGELERLGSLSEEFEEIGDDEERSSAKIGLMGSMIDKMATVLVWWNRPDEDTMAWNEETEEFDETPETKTLPANADGLRKLEDWEFMALVQSYFTHAVGVKADLGKDSSSGASSLAELPMTEQ